MILSNLSVYIVYSSSAPLGKGRLVYLIILRTVVICLGSGSFGNCRSWSWPCLRTCTAIVSLPLPLSPPSSKKVLHLIISPSSRFSLEYSLQFIYFLYSTELTVRILFTNNFMFNFDKNLLPASFHRVTARPTRRLDVFQYLTGNSRKKIWISYSKRRGLFFFVL